MNIKQQQGSKLYSIIEAQQQQKTEAQQEQIKQKGLAEIYNLCRK